MITCEQMLEALTDLDKNDFEVHTIDDAWYCARTITRALTNNPELIEAAGPSIKAVRIRLNVQGGMLELHPTNDNKIHVRCYCCFGGNPDKGVVELVGLKDAVLSLKEHYCPPWPG